MKNLFIIVILFALSSCSIEEKKNEKYLSKHIITLMPTLDKCYSKVIILPGSGCSGCITVGENFFKDNYNNCEYLFILTNITSIKILNYKTGVNISQLSNVISDYNNVYAQYNLSIYPTVIKYNCKKGKIESIIYQKPGSNAFDKI